ncbi:MAG: ISAs1 family transposase [Alphaproteobacteria bacterium]|nr:ISAs1 family transposase [Alphaproteobacteria bacterium]
MFLLPLEDPRSSRNRLHTMCEILFTTVCAAICGAEGWQDVEDFGRAKTDYLRHYFPYKNGITSDDTFRRFFRALDPEEFQSLFRKWIQGFQQEIGKNVIEIDGKSSRHSFDETNQKLHMISAFATEARLDFSPRKSV